MTTQTKAPPHSSSALELPLRRFTVAEYHAMAEAGILTEDDRVELLDGVIVNMAPIGSRHLGCVNAYVRAFTEAVGRRAIVQVQSPIRLDDGTEPQPDLVLLQERADFYASGHAGPQDVLLVIEVADSSVDYDRRRETAQVRPGGHPRGLANGAAGRCGGGAHGTDRGRLSSDASSASWRRAAARLLRRCRDTGRYRDAGWAFIP